MRSFLFSTVLLSLACLPQVGEPLDAGSDSDDAGVTGGGAGGGAGGGTAGGGAGGGAALCSNGLRDGTESDVDCGGACPACANSKSCGDARDCASGRCSAGTCEAPASVCPQAFSGCTSFVDLTTDPSPTVRFPVAGNRFSPNCLRLRLGQVVRFEGSFASHTLLQSCGPVPNQLQAANGQSLDVTLLGLGLYGYYCQQHGSPSGSGMAGAIEVVR
jgi:plastocyanin